MGGLSDGLMGGLSDGLMGGLSDGLMGGLSDGLMGGLSGGRMGALGADTRPGSGKHMYCCVDMVHIHCSALIDSSKYISNLSKVPQKCKKTRGNRQQMLWGDSGCSYPAIKFRCSCVHACGCDRQSVTYMPPCSFTPAPLVPFDTCTVPSVM